MTEHQLRPRVLAAWLIVRMAALLERTALMIMRPDDLMAFSRRYYSLSSVIDVWCDEEHVAQGLTTSEEDLLEGISPPGQRLLLLGLGGGREAIALARRGFQITGMDYVARMVKRAEENATRQGVILSGSVQELSAMELAPDSFDVVWLAAGMYSAIPTRKRRIEMLRRAIDALSLGGYFLCQFLFDIEPRRPSRLDRVGRLIARLTSGNVSHEYGDKLLGNAYFMHFFGGEEELKQEFEEAGFELVRFCGGPGESMKGAVLLKLSISSQSKVDVKGQQQ